MRKVLRTVFVVFLGQGLSLGEEREDGSLWNMDVPYVENEHRRHERHRLNLVAPPREEGKKLPLVVWIHGGAFWEGSKDDWHPARALYDKGFAVCSINYRLSNSSTFPAQVQDCKAAIRWIRKHADRFGIDPDRIGVWGASAGGYLATMVGVTGGLEEFDSGENLDQSSRVRCVVDYFGPTDFLKMNEQAKGVPGAEKWDHDHADSPESILIGGPIQERVERVTLANPCGYATKDDPPFLVVHGRKDGLVAIGQSELLVEALKAAGVPVEFRVVEEAGHGEGFGEAEQKAAEEFFIRHLRP